MSLNAIENRGAVIALISPSGHAKAIADQLIAVYAKYLNSVGP